MAVIPQEMIFFQIPSISPIMAILSGQTTTWFFRNYLPLKQNSDQSKGRHHTTLMIMYDLLSRRSVVKTNTRQSYARSWASYYLMHLALECSTHNKYDQFFTHSYTVYTFTAKLIHSIYPQHALPALVIHDCLSLNYINLR